MIIHFSILALIIVVSVVYERQTAYHKLLDSKYTMPITPWLFVFGYLAILAGFRSSMNDTSVYIDLFKRSPGDLEKIAEIWENTDKDKGFYAFQNIFKAVASEEYHAWFLFFSILTSISFIYVFRRESYSFFITCFYFFVSTLYYNYFSMMRQWVAVAVVFFGVYWIRDRKWLPYFILCVIAGQFHESAYLCIMFYFIANGTPFSMKQNVFIALTAVFIRFLDPILENMSVALEGTTYDYVIEEMATNSGSSPVRILISVVPVVIAFCARRPIASENNKILNIAVNMSVLCFLMNIIASRTSGLYIIRMATYMTVYNAILYSFLIEHCFNERSKKIVKAGFIVLYFMYYMYQMSYMGAWGYGSDILGNFY